MAKAYVFSDLHAGAKNSEADKIWPEINVAAERAKFIVLNGDLYELLYNADKRKKVDKALEHIEDLVSAHPECTFHFVLGNHEVLRSFSQGLEELAQKHPNLEIHDNAFKMGNSLYLHGDIALKPKGEIDGGESRKIYNDRHPKMLVKSSHLGCALVGSPLKKTYQRWRAKKFYTGKDGDVEVLQKKLERADPELSTGVEHVFYGHTHDAKMIEDHQGKGVSYHNSGAGLRGVVFNPLQLDVDDNNNVRQVRHLGLGIESSNSGVGTRSA